MNITFNEELHEYRDEKGNIIPSVTQIIQGAGLVDFSRVSQGVLDDASLRGTVVHKITELYDHSELEETTVDPQLVGFLVAYKKFLADYKVKGFIAIESIVFHDGFRYAGTLDRVVELEDGRKMLLDIKTGEESPAHDLQVAAYLNARPDAAEIDQVGTLYLHADGTYKFKKTENPAFAFRVFVAALTLYRWKQENKLI